MFKNKTNEEIFEIAHAGNKEARDYLITSNINLVYKIAYEFMNYLKEVDFESLVQEGSIGLMKAADKFEVERNLKFSTYATWSIKSQIYQYLRDRREDKPFRIKRVDKTLYNKALRTRDELQQKLLREPTLKEVSENIGVGIIELGRVFNCIDGHKSIYEVYHEGKDGTDIMQIDALENQNNLSEEQILNRMIIKDKLKKLKENQRKVIELRYFNDLTQLQVGQVLNVTQVQVSRLEKAALNNLREMIM
ncbi:sigma-70 family RNA polymerase sigma factor [Terrisporobacter sp.]|uniref:sigma-70 family RNA polymerase sigma factor n=1 Tax=Terrisporobacter sp. TaxID=1965305 RepID=UPI00260E1792|nr:sigma-70 family RNA polymerase sigma factor [Terrisporobacter sp.]